MANKWLKHFSIPRAKGVTTRQLVLGFLARFYDEFVGGMPDVLMPTLQAQLGLSLTQIGLLRQMLAYVTVVVEPINGMLIDVWQRKWLMSFGAALLGVSVMLIGVTYTFWGLLLAYIMMGFGGGPLTHTGDVVIVESYPSAPDRAFARSTIIDTFGALLAPLFITIFIWQSWNWRWLLAGAGILGLLYATAILQNGLPNNSAESSSEKQSLFLTTRQNIQHVLRDTTALRWLTMLFAFDILEISALLRTVWLAQIVGMSQTLIGVYVVAAHVVGILALLALDQWRRQASTRHVLQTVTVCVAFLYPLWLLVPGIWSRFLFMIPLTFFFSMFWPLLKANALASVPGRMGALTAIRSFLGLVPLPLLYGILADSVGMTRSMLGIHVVMISIIAGLVFFTGEE